MTFLSFVDNLLITLDPRLVDTGFSSTLVLSSCLLLLVVVVLPPGFLLLLLTLSLTYSQRMSRRNLGFLFVFYLIYSLLSTFTVDTSTTSTFF